MVSNSKIEIEKFNEKNFDLWILNGGPSCRQKTISGCGFWFFTYGYVGGRD
jgi:hypothetical protein